MQNTCQILRRIRAPVNLCWLNPVLILLFVILPIRQQELISWLKFRHQLILLIGPSICLVDLLCKVTSFKDDDWDSQIQGLLDVFDAFLIIAQDNSYHFAWLLWVVFLAPSSGDPLCEFKFERSFILPSITLLWLRGFLRLLLLLWLFLLLIGRVVSD